MTSTFMDTAVVLSIGWQRSFDTTSPHPPYDYSLTIDSIIVDYDTIVQLHNIVAQVNGPDGYSYGYNGEAKDNEWAGYGNHYNYGFRTYDPRIARFKSLDPLTKQYPMLTPYQFASNSPLSGVDLDGLEWIGAITMGREKVWGIAFVKATNSEQINIPINKAGDGNTTDFQNALRSASVRDPNGIGFLAVFAHGDQSNDETKLGNMMFANAHLHPNAGNVFSAEITQIKSSIDAGEIRFAEGAVIYLGACNAGTTFDNATVLAQELANVTGVSVIAMKGTQVGPKDPNSPNNTVFIPYNAATGQWYVFEAGKEPVLYGKSVDVAKIGNETIQAIQRQLELKAKMEQEAKSNEKNENNGSQH